MGMVECWVVQLLFMNSTTSGYLSPIVALGRRHEARVRLFQARDPLPLSMGEHRQEPRRLLAREAILGGRAP